MTRAERMHHMVDVAERVLPEGVRYEVVRTYDIEPEPTLRVQTGCDEGVAALRERGATLATDWYGTWPQREWVVVIDGVVFKAIEAYSERLHGPRWQLEVKP